MAKDQQWNSETLNLRPETLKLRDTETLGLTLRHWDSEKWVCAIVWSLFIWYDEKLSVFSSMRMTWAAASRGKKGVNRVICRGIMNCWCRHDRRRRYSRQRIKALIVYIFSIIPWPNAAQRDDILDFLKVAQKLFLGEQLSLETIYSHANFLSVSKSSK